MHAGAFEASSDGQLAAGFDHAGGSAQPLLVEIRIAHAVSVGFEVLEALPRLFADGEPGNGLQQSIELSIVEFGMPAFRPLGGTHVGGTVDRLAQVAEVLLGVEAINDLDRTREQFLGDVPYPGRAVAQHHAAFGLAETASRGLAAGRAR